MHWLILSIAQLDLQLDPCETCVAAMVTLVRTPITLTWSAVCSNLKILDGKGGVIIKDTNYIS